MIVYRVERPHCHSGPYWSNRSGWLDCLHADSSRHPNPLDDGLLGEFWLSVGSDNNRAEYRFGFLSERQMYNWLSDDVLLKLSKLGFVPVTYEAKISARSDRQCIFKIESARFLGNL